MSFVGPRCSCQPALLGAGRLQLLLKILIHSRGGIEIFGQPISLGAGHLQLSLGGGRRSYAAKGLSQVFVCLGPLIPGLCLFFNNCNLPIAGCDYLVKLVEKACLATATST